jgi:L-alanine-DL-glutamate epimerase-like enolase superfamily enzyme
VPRLEVTPVRLALRQPVVAAWGVLRERVVLRVRLEWDAGDFGVGEAAPLEPYDGVPLAAVAAALQAYGSVLAAADAGAGHDALLAACAAERPLAQALAAIDLALWDRAGRRAGRSVASLLAPGAATSVAVNATLGAEDRAGAAAEAPAAARAGFGCVKLKVGIGDDPGRVAAVRAALGPAIAIRVDANGAWSSVDEALAHLIRARPGRSRVRRGAARRDRGAAGPASCLSRAAGDGRDGRGAGRGRLWGDRGGLPQDRPLRRDHGRAA